MISWLGTIASVLGSFTVAFQVFTLGYVFFMVGSISWLTVAVIRRDKALGVLNLCFLSANVVGLWKSFSTF